MYEKIRIEKLKAENANVIVNWCKDKDEDFLRQWAGRGYIYPLTETQISERLEDGAEIFEAHLNGKVIGTIEIISREKQDNTALIGRFILDPSVTGKGLGTEVLQTFLQYCKENLGFAEISLCVFDFNVGAHRCYQKCGFVETGRAERPNGWKAINMKKVL